MKYKEILDIDKLSDSTFVLLHKKTKVMLKLQAKSLDIVSQILDDIELDKNNWQILLEVEYQRKSKRIYI